MTTLVTAELLRAAFPENASRFEVWGPLFEPAMQEFNITTALRKIDFIAHVTHECGDFCEMAENMNYSANGLMRTWPKRFPTLESASALARQPERIANTVYANRMGNGDYASGDGFRYRGQGPIQITGKEMYEKIASVLNIDIVNHPELMTAPYYQPTDDYGQPAFGADGQPMCVPGPGLRVSAWFYAIEKRCLTAADNYDLETTTRKINGGLIGLPDRRRRRDILAQYIVD